MKASIIILNWNTTKDTIECLESLKHQTSKDFEIIVVDNNSQEDQFGQLKTYTEKQNNINLIRSTASLPGKPNLGFAAGNNVGIEKAKGDVIVLLNNDAIADKNWLEEVTKPFSDSEVGAVASKVLFYDGNKNDTIQYVGGRLTFYGMAISEHCGEKDVGKYNTSKETSWAMGASFAVRKDVLDKLGEYLCPHYFTYFEETDLCWRIRSSGYKIIYNPKSIAFHKGSVSVKKNNMSFTQDRFTTRNKYYTFFRNLPLPKFLILTPFILGCDVARSIKNAIRGRPAFAVGFALGLKDFILNAGTVPKPRMGKLRDLSW